MADDGYDSMEAEAERTALAGWRSIATRCVTCDHSDDVHVVDHGCTAPGCLCESMVEPETVYTPEPGEHVLRFAERMYREHQAVEGRAVGVFNDTRVVLTDDLPTPESWVREWESQRNPAITVTSKDLAPDRWSMTMAEARRLALFLRTVALVSEEGRAEIATLLSYLPPARCSTEVLWRPRGAPQVILQCRKDADHDGPHEWESD